jgi:hypothetical protein
MNKSTATRNARKAFTKRYGTTAAGVIRLLATGSTTSEISTSFGVPRTTVAAYKANLTRGNYYPYVTWDGRGACNFRK